MAVGGDGSATNDAGQDGGEESVQEEKRVRGRWLLPGLEEARGSWTVPV